LQEGGAGSTLGLMALSRRSFLARAGLATAATIFIPRLAGYDWALAQAAAPAKANPWNAQTFKVGALKVTAFRDGTLEFPLRLLTNAPAGEAEAVLTKAGLPTDQESISFNILLVEEPATNEKLLIDTGWGVGAGEKGGGLLPALRACGVPPEKITGIVLSHAHSDHYGGLLDAAGKPVFPNARLFITKTEYNFWASGGADLSKTALPADARKQTAEASAKALAAFNGKWEKVDADQKIVEGVWLLPAPGHTPGHSALILASGNDQLLHVVDAAHNHILMFARPEWTMAYDTDPAQAVATRRRLFDRAAADKLRVMGYHLPFPGTGRIVAEGKGYKWLGEVFSA